MMQAAYLDRWRKACAWPTLIGSALAAGCAGGAWLESPIEAELPIDAPKHSYPTALPAASVNAPVVNAAAAPAPQANPQPTDPAHPASSTAQAQQSIQQPPNEQQANQQRLERPQPLRTNLAVIPPQYVHRSTSASPAAAPASAAPATASSLTAPAVSTPATTSPAPPSSSAALPQLDLSFLDTLANSPVVQASPASSSSSGKDVASDATNAKSAVQQVSAESSESSTPHERLEKAQSALIEALEAEIRRRREASATDEEVTRLEQQLRLVYAAAGRLDDAVSVVESLDASQREAYKNLMFGLSVWLSPDEARRAPLRTAKVLHALRDATGDLTASSKLELKNLALCEVVEQFGWYTEFPRKEFQPKQQVILYAEVENFAAEQKGPTSYETELQGSYVILDSSGQEVASRQLQLDKEVCRNYRRDYFLAYRIYLPDNIPPGRYRLELTVEDLKARGKYQGRKLGEGVIEFTIR